MFSDESTGAFLPVPDWISMSIFSIAGIPSGAFGQWRIKI